ncbi:hypothetical protein LINPERPRIM_LOCUS20893 [Linum perenne]
MLILSGRFLLSPLVLLIGHISGCGTPTARDTSLLNHATMLFAMIRLALMRKNGSGFGTSASLPWSLQDSLSLKRSLLLRLALMEAVCNLTYRRTIAQVCAEAYAVLHAVNLAKLGNSPVTIFSDCAIVVEALKNPPHSWPWECESILASIIKALRNGDWITIQHCKRQIVCKAYGDTTR